MSDPAKAVFLSYASQDAEAAKRIAEALRAAGIEVWFDQNELVGGDAWDAKIRGQVASCALFVPVISANTQARLEGYFRLEWKIAAQRTHTMADEKVFLLPVVIDATRDAEARVPVEFKSVQWTRLPAGEASAAFCARLQKLLEADGLTAAAPTASIAPTVGKPTASKARWLGYGWTAVGLGFAVFYLARPMWSARRATREPATAQATKAEASRPTDRALQLRALNGLTRDRLAAAEDLLAAALKVDPTNALALALAAQVDALMVYRSWDLSEERRQLAAARSARALALAPDDFESRRAQALVAGFMVATTASLQEAEKLYRTLAAERVDDPNVLEELGTVLQSLRKFDEAAQVFTRAGRPQLAGVALYWARRLPEARRIADELLAQGRSAAALILKANVELFGYNDREAAQAAVDQLTPTELREDDAAGIALRLAVLRRDAEGLLRLLEPFPHPFVSILGVNYPRQYWTGLARSWQNQPEAAEIEWRGGLRSLEERLAAKPSDADALSWLAMLQACLGQRAEMERALRTYGNYHDLSAGRWDYNYCLPLLRYGERKEEVISRLSKSLRDSQHFNRILYAWARYSPEFDPIRGDPQFERLLRETRPQTAAPFDDETTAASTIAAPAEKSVAVLAFANLSDDKANEYFSDGISEELLNVLAKIPGLKVAARTSAFYFKGRDVPMAEIAQKLGVAYVVEGSVRKAGDKVRIAAQLVKAADGFQVWGDTFTRDLKDVFAVQDELAQTIVTQLRSRIAGGTPVDATSVSAQVAAAEKGGTRNVEAHELYLRAKFLRKNLTIADTKQAESLLRRAVELDPDYALGWAELSRIGWGEAGYGMTPAEVTEGFRLAREAAQRALEIEPDLIAGLMALFNVQAAADFDWKGVAGTLKRAQALAPDDPEVAANVLLFTYTRGDAAKAAEMSTELAKRDPMNAELLTNCGFSLLAARQPERAETFFRRIVEFSPESPWGHAGVALALAVQGRGALAVEAARRSTMPWARAFALSVALWANNQRPESETALQQLISGYGEVAAFQIAGAYAFRHDKDQTFAWLDRAYRQRDPGLSWCKGDYFLSAVHDDPRWAVFLRAMGLSDEQLN